MHVCMSVCMYVCIYLPIYIYRLLTDNGPCAPPYFSESWSLVPSVQLTEQQVKETEQVQTYLRYWYKRTITDAEGAACYRLSLGDGLDARRVPC